MRQQLVWLVGLQSVCNILSAMDVSSIALIHLATSRWFRWFHHRYTLPCYLR